jgi:signal peptide peptidase SppA
MAICFEGNAGVPLGYVPRYAYLRDMMILARLNPFRRRAPVVAVVRLSGVIGDAGPLRRGLNLQTLTPRLEAAFSGRRTKAVALVINSPGGSPVQSDLIQQRVRELSREKEIPVFVFCEDVAASGGYWIALAGNEIYANPSSIIGSIGVISAGFGFEQAIAKLGVERRMYATGPNKGMLDPFQPEDPAHVAHLRSLHRDIFTRFQAWVRERRGARLKGDESELFSGAFWTGSKALELGLIDGLDDMRSVMRGRYGDKVRFRTYAASEGLLRRLGLRPSGLVECGGGWGGGWADELLASIEARALWSRFGL